MNYKDIRVAFFLTRRYIRGSSFGTIFLIIFVMLITFLNLTVIGGILEGIPVGALEGSRTKALGDVYISSKDGESYVDRSYQISSFLEKNPLVAAFSPRYSGSVEIIAEDEFRSVTNNNKRRESLDSFFIGIDPEKEDRTTKLSNNLIEGSYFSPDGRQEVLIGSILLERYSPFGMDVLGDISPGDYVYLRIAGPQNPLRKYQVQGIFRTKAGELDAGVFLRDDEVRLYSLNPGNHVSSIAIQTRDPADAVALKDSLIAAGFESYAEVETVYEAVGQFLDDIRTVFSLLGSVVGGIGLMVASITIFIIIFITASSRRKFIGILKAIGITPGAIRLSYILYSLFFAVAGITLGAMILFFGLIPYFNANPIQFPFSDGILYAPVSRVAFQVGLLMFAILIAGFIPAHRVVRRPAIEAVRGR